MHTSIGIDESTAHPAFPPEVGSLPPAYLPSSLHCALPCPSTLRLHAPPHTPAGSPARDTVDRPSWQVQQILKEGRDHRTNVGQIKLFVSDPDPFTRLDHCNRFRADAFGRAVHEAARHQGGGAQQQDDDPADTIAQLAGEHFGDASVGDGAAGDAKFVEITKWVATKIRAKYRFDPSDQLLAVSRQDVDSTMAYDGSENAKDYAAPLIRLAKVVFIGNTRQSHFKENTTDGNYGRQVRLQLFCGLVSLYAKVYHRSNVNLGQRIDRGDPRTAAAELIAESRKAAPERAIIAYLVRKYSLPVGLNRLSEVDKISVAFDAIWGTIVPPASLSLPSRHTVRRHRPTPAARHHARRARAATRRRGMPLCRRAELATARTCARPPPVLRTNSLWPSPNPGSAASVSCTTTRSASPSPSSPARKRPGRSIARRAFRSSSG